MTADMERLNLGASAMIINDNDDGSPESRPRRAARAVGSVTVQVALADGTLVGSFRHRRGPRRDRRRHHRVRGADADARDREPVVVPVAATAPAFRRVGAAALLVVLSGCAGVSPPTAAPGLLAVGETLHLVNGQFVTVSALMNQLYDGKIITTAQYAPWRAFAPRYQQLYPLAVEGWIAAKRTCIPPPPAVPDPAACTVQSATSTAQATALATELATLAAEAYKAIAGWGSAGAPAAAVPVQVAPQVQVQPPPPALAPPPAPPPTPPRRVAPENPDVPDFGRVIDWLMSEYEKPEK